MYCCCSSTSAADTRCSCSCWRQQGHLAQPKARSAGRSFSPSTTHSTSLQTFYTLPLHPLPAAGFDCDSWRCDSDIGRQTGTETHWEANKKEEKGKQTRKEKKFRRCDVAAKATDGRRRDVAMRDVLASQAVQSGSQRALQGQIQLHDVIKAHHLSPSLSTTDQVHHFVSHRKNISSWQGCEGTWAICFSPSSRAPLLNF